MNEVIYDCRWTNETNEQFLKDWQSVENGVFSGFTDEFIKRKYFDNIYGPSILVVAYLNGKAIGADALWRNDVDGKMAFQSADTCVLKEARGHGVMTELIKHKIAKAPTGCYLYGSPNEQSYPGFKKLGWNEINLYPAILFSPKKYAKEHPIKMPYDYAKWWITGPNKYHIKFRSHYYIVVKYSFLPFWYVTVIAEVEKRTAELYPRYRGISLFFYRSFKPMINYGIFKHAGHHISWKGDPQKFPYWKVDGFCE